MRHKTNVGLVGGEMKKFCIFLFAITLFVFCFNDCVAATEEERAYATINGEFDKWKIYGKDFKLLMSKKPPDIEKAEVIVTGMADVANKLQPFCNEICPDKYSREACKYCRRVFKVVAKTQADMMLECAQYYARTGDKERAKKLYREIITNFVGDDYKSQVKKAEFGLEDLK